MKTDIYYTNYHHDVFCNNTHFNYVQNFIDDSAPYARRDRGINFLFDMFNFYLPLGSLNTKSTMLYKKCKC